MRRSIILFAALLALLLTACGPAATPVPTVSAQPQPPDAQVQPTTAPQPAKPAAANTPEPAKPAATPDMQEVLNPQGVNCLRFFYGRGNRVWGARTASSDPGVTRSRH